MITSSRTAFPNVVLGERWPAAPQSRARSGLQGTAIAATCDDIASKNTPAKAAELRGSTSACLAKDG